MAHSAMVKPIVRRLHDLPNAIGSIAISKATIDYPSPLTSFEAPIASAVEAPVGSLRHRDSADVAARIDACCSKQLVTAQRSLGSI